MIAALFVLLLLSDAAIVALFLALRGQRTPAVVAPPHVPAQDVAAQIGALRLHAEQASAELSRQQLQLRRLLHGPSAVETPATADMLAALSPATVVAARAAPADSPRLVPVGVPAATAAARAGVSLEEIRLVLAMGEPRATA